MSGTGTVPAEPPKGVWRERSVAGIAIAEVLSQIGTEMTWLALPWFVLVTTHSATRMGIVFAVEIAPAAILGIPAGAIVDRFGARRTMLACDLIRMPLFALLPLLHDANVLSFPILLILVAAGGAFTAPYVVCQRLILPEALGDDETKVAQANTVVEGATSTAGLIGPAVAGVLISVVGALNVIWIDAASYGVSFAVVLLLVTSRAHAEDEQNGTGILDGIRYLAKDSMTRSLAAAVLLAGFWGAFLVGLLPVLAFVRYGANPRVAGLLFTAMSGGVLVGSIVSYRALEKVPPTRLARIALVWITVFVSLLVIRMPAIGVGGILVLEGLLIPSVNAPIFTLLTTRVDEEIRAKVLTAVVAINTVAGPLGYVVVGPSVRGLGLTGSLGAVAVLALCTTILFYLATRGPMPDPRSEVDSAI